MIVKRNANAGCSRFQTGRRGSGNSDLPRAPLGVLDRRRMQGTYPASASTITSAVAVLFGCLTTCKSAAGPQARTTQINASFAWPAGGWPTGRRCGPPRPVGCICGLGSRFEQHDLAAFPVSPLGGLCQPACAAAPLNAPAQSPARGPAGRGRLAPMIVNRNADAGRSRLRDARRRVSGSSELPCAPPGVLDRGRTQGTYPATASTITNAVAALLGCLTTCASAAGDHPGARTNLRSTDRHRRSVPERSSGPTGPSAACAC